MVASSAKRRSASRERSRARRSPTRVAISEVGGWEKGRTRPSPRSMARTPFIQPRQLRWATKTVIKEIMTPSTAKRTMTYLRVSELRRSTKLISWTRTREPTLQLAVHDRVDGHMDRTLGQADHRFWVVWRLGRQGAAQGFRESRRAIKQLFFLVAKSQGKKPFIADGAKQQMVYLWPCCPAPGVRSGALEGYW